jgi:hypothetical protein
MGSHTTNSTTSERLTSPLAIGMLAPEPATVLVVATYSDERGETRLARCPFGRRGIRARRAALALLRRLLQAK